MIDTPTDNSRPGAAALVLAGSGWKVLPCWPGEKIPATDHGVHDATADLERVRRWWAMTPAANLAVAPGCSDVVVVDVDPPGIAAWRGLLAEHPDTQKTPMLTGTPRGGWHLWWRHPDPGMRLAGRLATGIDVKSTGGIVLVPPSVVAGRSYRWLAGPTVPGRLPDLPRWIYDRLRGNRPAEMPVATLAEPARGDRTRCYVRAAVVAVLADLAQTPVGCRNSALFRAALRLGNFTAAGVLTDADAVALLHRAGTETGLPVDEIRRTAASGLRAGAARPWTGAP